MYSISEVSKLTELTARTLRHYEEKGLVTASRRGSNGYRYYDDNVLNKLLEIKKLKEMDFSLSEIKKYLELKDENLEESLTKSLKEKLESISSEVSRLMKTKSEIETQLLATEDFFKGKVLAKGQRRVLMETIKSEILSKLKTKKSITKKDLDYLKREDYLVDTKEKREFLEVVKECIEFANTRGIKLGPIRGASPALLSLYALGVSEFDPTEYDLVPERFSGQGFDLHIDVEFERGREFIDFCRYATRNLKHGSIEAFKLPILDIIDNVHKRLGFEINFDAIDKNDPIIMDQIRKGDLEKIYSLDIPENTLLAKHYDDGPYKSGEFLKQFSEYIKSQKIIDFNDLLNISAIYRPESLESKPFMKEYIERYPNAKENRHYYDSLSSSLNEYLSSNYGVIIYQEDIIEIIREYTGWGYEKCNQFRRAIGFNKFTAEQKKELSQYVDSNVMELLLKETPVTFCKAHSVGAWPELIKKTAILKALHRDIYFDEIEKWESQNGYSWGDFGFISGGVSLLQQ